MKTKNDDYILESKLKMHKEMDPCSYLDLTEKLLDKSEVNSDI